MALKACLVVGSYSYSEQVLQFSKSHNYLLTLDEEVVWHLVQETQYEQRMYGDYSILTLLLRFEVIYKINVTDENRAAVNDS